MRLLARLLCKVCKRAWMVSGGMCPNCRRKLITHPDILAMDKEHNQKFGKLW